MKPTARCRALAAALLACVFAAGTARADGAGIYLSVAAGGQILGEDTLSGAGGVIEPEYTVGPVAAAALGYELPFLPIRIEAEIGYRSSGFDDVSVISGTPIAPGSGLAASGSARVYSGMVNGYLFLPVPVGLEPYVGIGLGYARLEIDNLSVGGTTLADGKDMAFAFQGIAGVEFDLIPGPIDIGLEYRYFAMDEVTISGAAGSFGLNYASHAAMLRVRLSL